jgi:hypothetical protein
MHYEQRSGAS